MPSKQRGLREGGKEGREAKARRLNLIVLFHRADKESSLTETMNILMMFDRSFFTERIAVMSIIFPTSPKNMKTKTSMAPKNVACRVGSRSGSDSVAKE